MNRSKRLMLLACGVTSLGLTCAAAAQEPFAYPPAGRTPEQQKQDQYECHQWAVEQSHFDPVQYAAQAPQPAPKQQPNQPRSGGGIVAGAARGALVAEVADEDTGDGARAGATLGLLRQRRAQGAASAEQARAQQQAQLEQQRQRAELEGKQDSYQRARSTCYRARGYTLSEG
jgi:hypothetical protein